MVCHFCDVTFCLRRILAVRIWRNLLFLIGCVIGSREEHLCLVHVLFWSSGIVGCCQLFVTEAASDVSDVDQMDMRFAEFELCQILVSEVELGTGLYGCGFVSVLWYLRWTMVWDVGVRQSLVSEVDPLFFVDIVWDPSEVCCWGGSCWCRRRNLLLLIRFQHEGVCEAWSVGSWLPWWTI